MLRSVERTSSELDGRAAPAVPRPAPPRPRLPAAQLLCCVMFGLQPETQKHKWDVLSYPNPTGSKLIFSISSILFELRPGFRILPGPTFLLPIYFRRALMPPLPLHHPTGYTRRRARQATTNTSTPQSNAIQTFDSLGNLSTRSLFVRPAPRPPSTSAPRLHLN